MARVLDSRLEAGLPLRRGPLEFRLQRGQLLAVRGDLLLIVVFRRNWIAVEDAGGVTEDLFA